MALENESVFNLKQQQNNVDSKIIVAFEKISEVYRVLLWNEGKEAGLSPIQLQILIFIKYHEEDQCKVGFLAKEFNLTKPTISDSIKTLLKKGFVIKIIDKIDSRSYSLALTQEGQKLTEQVEHYTKDFALPIQNITKEKKDILLETMIEILHKLQQNGLIEKQRMCFNCAHYKGDKMIRHYCEFLKKSLSKADLRIDCLEFEAAN